MGSSSPRPTIPRALLLAAALLFLPLVGALAAVLAHPEVATQRIGDEAPFEARVLTFFDPPPLLGPYSRHRWSHPGPLVFWLFGPPYLAFGRQPYVLQLAALALSAVALASIVRSVLRLTASFAARALGLGCVAILVSKASLTLDPAGTATTWGPACTLLPFAALVLLSAELATGAFRVLPFVLLLHAFVVQTHVLYLVPATLAATLGLALGVRADRGAARGPALRSGSLLVLLWAPVLGDELLGSGNLDRIASFFLHTSIATSPGPGDAAALFVWRATEPLRDLVGLGPAVARPDPLSEVSGVSIAIAAALVLALAFMLARGIARHRHEPRHGGAALAVIVLALLVTGMPLLLRVDVPEWPYLTWWIGALAVLGGLAVGATQLERALDAHGQRIASVACVAAVLVISLHTQTQLGRLSAFAVGTGAHEAESFEPLFPIVEEVAACRPDLQLDVGEESLWGVLGATLTHFEREGTHLSVAPGWEFMFGAGYHGGSARGRVVLLPWDDHGCPAVARTERLRLADCRAEGGALSLRSDAVPLALTPWRAEGVRGALDLLVDGARGADGAAWDAPGALVLESEASSVTLGVPPARLTRIAITSDDNDELAIEISPDGERWEPLVRVPPTHAWGQRTHVVDLPTPRAARALRIAPVAGDGAYAISEIAVEGEPDVARVVHVEGARGDTAVLTDGVASAEGGLATLEGDAPSITLELPPSPVGGLALVANGARAFRVEGSIDGETFWELGTIPAAEAPGTSTRRFYLDEDVLAAFVRLTALPGEGPIEIAEIALVGTPGVTVDVGLRAARPALREGFSSHEGDERWAWIVGTRAHVVVPWPAELVAPSGVDVLVALAPFAGLEAPGTLTVRIGDAQVDVPLAPGLQTAHAHVPASALAEAAASGELGIVLAPSAAVSPASRGWSDDARPLSIAVHRVEIRPALLFCAR